MGHVSSLDRAEAETGGAHPVNAVSGYDDDHCTEMVSGRALVVVRLAKASKQGILTTYPGVLSYAVDGSAHTGVTRNRWRRDATTYK